MRLPRQTEVHDERLEAPVVRFRDQDVRGLHVPVDEAHAMRFVEGFRHVAHQDELLPEAHLAGDLAVTRMLQDPRIGALELPGVEQGRPVDVPDDLLEREAAEGAGPQE